MNKAICATTWREFKANKVRCSILTLLFLLPVAFYTLVRLNWDNAYEVDMISPPIIALAYTLLWSVGVIGREVQNGTIGLVFTRPITIANYVVSKWFAVSFAAAICSVQAGVIEHLISSFYNPSLLFSLEFFSNCCERVFICFGFAAVMVMLSSLVSGMKDIAVLAGFALLWGITNMIGGMLRSDLGIFNQYANVIYPLAGLVDLYNKMMIQAFFPSLSIEPMLDLNFLYLPAILNYGALVTACLASSIFLLNRKEFSYAAD